MLTSSTFYLTRHLLKYEWNFTGGGGHSLLWLEATTFLNHREPIRGLRLLQLLVAEGHKD